MAGRRSVIIGWLCIDTELFTTWYGSLRGRDTNPTWGHEERFPEVRGKEILGRGHGNVRTGSCPRKGKSEKILASGDLRADLTGMHAFGEGA